jgi:hypothetical protein
MGNLRRYLRRLLSDGPGHAPDARTPRRAQGPTQRDSKAEAGAGSRPAAQARTGGARLITILALLGMGWIIVAAQPGARTVLPDRTAWMAW